MLITTVRLDQVVPHPHNVRRDIGDVTELAESFKSSGMLQPLVVAPAVDINPICSGCGTGLTTKPGGKVPAHGRGKKECKPSQVEALQRYTLIAGHRRCAAADLLQWPQVEVIVRDDLNTEAKQIEAMAIENLQRVNLTPVEEARGYQQLLDLGYTPAKIAKNTGRNAKTVKLRLGLLKLGDKASEKLHTGQITIDQAEVLASFAKDPKAYKDLESSIGTPNFAWKVQSVKAEQVRKAKVQKLREHLRADGVTEIKRTSDFPWYSTEKPLSTYYGASYGLDIDPADHASCPGHAAILIDDHTGPRVEYVCTDPKANGHITDASVDDPAAAERSRAQAAEKAANHQRTEDMRLAVVARREFAVDVMKRQRLSPGVEVRLLRSVLMHAVQAVLYDGEASNLAEMLGFDVEAFDELDVDTLQLAFFAAHMDNQLDVTDLLKLLFAVHVVDADPGIHSWHDEHVPAYCDLLTQAGYEISDVERAELDRAHPSPTPAVEDVEPSAEFAEAL